MATKTKMTKTSALIPRTRIEPPVQENDMEMEYVLIDNIYQWKDNPNTHNETGIKNLAGSLEKYGQTKAIVVWRNDKQIRAGNGTHLAAKLLGWKYIWVSWRDFMNKAEADAYGAMDEASQEWSELDQEKLSELFQREDVQDLVGNNRQRLAEFTGFSEDDIRGILLEPDFDKVDRIKSEGSGLDGTIKITCRSEDLKEIRELLSQWADECGFDKVIVK